MRRPLIFACVFALLGAPVDALAQPRQRPAAAQPAAAQPAPAAQPQPGQEEDEDSQEEDYEEQGGEGEEGEGEPQLRPPEVEPIQVPPGGEGEGEAGGEGEVPEPGEMQDRLEHSAPSGDAGAAATGWTAPQVTFDLHGYFRVRGEMQDTFWLG